MRKTCSVVCCFFVLALIGLESCRAQQPWPRWQAYTKRYIDGQGRVIDHSAGERTTSEGQAYALFFALVDNDKDQFAKLLSWTEANLAGGDLTSRLPAWHWGQTAKGEWKTIDDNPASDADVWTAYTLIQAGRLWQNPRYDKLGRLIAERIAREETAHIPGFGTALLPGSRGFQAGTGAYLLNPSYLPLPVLVNLANTLPQGPWAAILKAFPRLLSLPSTHGFAMDWVIAGAGGVQPAEAPAQTAGGAQPTRAGGSYDAIRVYLWLGLADPGTPGRGPLLSQVAGMAQYLRTALIPPREVSAQGTVVQPDGPAGFSAAMVPYLHALGMQAEARLQEDRLVATQDSVTGAPNNASVYYSENLVLFSTGWGEKRYRFDRSGELRVHWK